MNKDTFIAWWRREGKLTIIDAEQEGTRRSLSLRFVTDFDVYPLKGLNFSHIARLLHKIAMLNPGLKLKFCDLHGGSSLFKALTFHCPNGVAEGLDMWIIDRLGGKPALRLDLRKVIGAHSYQFSICYWDFELPSRFVETYANLDRMKDGGALERGVMNGIRKAMLEFAEKKKKVVRISSKQLERHVMLIAAVKREGIDPTGAIRWSWDFPELKAEVRDYVCGQMIRWFKANPEVGERILSYFEME